MGSWRKVVAVKRAHGFCLFILILRFIKEVRGYKSLVDELSEKFPVGEQIIGEQNQKNFIVLYSSILRVRNILTTFDEFTGNEVLTERDVQDYHSMYIDLYNEFRKGEDNESENINDDI